MDRRLIGFLLGAGLGLFGIYLARRVQKGQGIPLLPRAATPPSLPEPSVSNQASQTNSASQISPKFTVRTTGRRPQGAEDAGETTSKFGSEITGETESIPGVKIDRSTEPVAATETDVAATSSRAEMFEATVPFAEVEPAHTVAEETPEISFTEYADPTANEINFDQYPTDQTDIDQAKYSTTANETAQNPYATTETAPYFDQSSTDQTDTYHDQYPTTETAPYFDQSSTAGNEPVATVNQAWLETANPTYEEPQLAAENLAEPEPVGESEMPAVIEDVPTTPISQPHPVSGEKRDDFTIIIGVGDAFNRKLHATGITTFTQLAQLSTEEIAQKTGISDERIERDKWQEQAAELAKAEADVQATQKKASKGTGSRGATRKLN